jgi:hypothetical protein
MIKLSPISQSARRTSPSLEKLDQFVANKFRIAFGNRIQKQMRAFCANFVACGGKESDALDLDLRFKSIKENSRV